jgi:hypothetical protein
MFTYTCKYNHICVIQEYGIIVRGKRKLVAMLFLTEHHAMKGYWGVEV